MQTAFAGNGTLFIIATPIGNMEDISVRAINIIKSLDYLLSEDTRETAKLLNHYNIEKSQISYREQNHIKVKDQILQMLANGLKLGLVSDSGTPLISDPGFKLVTEVLNAGFAVEVVPGASSVISALVVSGLPTDKFSFVGFLPRTDSHRAHILSSYGNLDGTLIIFESPFRVVKLLNEIESLLGQRKVAVVSELTKVYEQVVRGTVSEVKATIGSKKLKGEYIVLVAKKDY